MRVVMERLWLWLRLMRGERARWRIAVTEELLWWKSGR